MMEKEAEARALAEKRFGNPSKLAEARSAWKPPERGPNVGAIYTDDAVKKLLGALVSKEARKALAEIEVEKGIKRATSAKTDWLEEHLAAKGVTRGDGDTWKAAQLKPILESFGWAPLPGASRGPRRSSAGTKSNHQPAAPKSAVDSLLLPFMAQVEEEQPEGPTESEQIIQLREELANIERELVKVARRHEALKRAKAWWLLRILRLNEHEEDPGASPPEDWTPEEATAPVKKTSRSRRKR